MEWQPIKTAPKDGTRVLAVVRGWQVCVGRWDGDQWMYLDADDFFSDKTWHQYCAERAEAGAEWEPTHWMPLPATPQ